MNEQHCISYVIPKSDPHIESGPRFHMVFDRPYNFPQSVWIQTPLELPKRPLVRLRRHGCQVFQATILGKLVESNFGVPKGAPNVLFKMESLGHPYFKIFPSESLTAPETAQPPLKALLERILLDSLENANHTLSHCMLHVVT